MGPNIWPRPNTRYPPQKSGFKQAAAGRNLGCIAGRQEQMGADSKRVSVWEGGMGESDKQLLSLHFLVSCQYIIS